MLKEDGSQSSKQRPTLLVHGRKIGSNATKGGHAIFGSESASDLSREL
jgi:hypothetical protein